MNRRPIVIAHRGASGERPEHTLAAYQLAIDQGADFIEPDLVMTRDGVLVARHENEIGDTTDVAARPPFEARRSTRVIDGVPVTGWFTEDFTLAELKTLRARERLPQLRPGNSRFDGQFDVPTFEEVVALARRRDVGIYPELKHPSYFRALGLSMEEALASTLERYGLAGREAPVFVQCFEVTALQRLRQMIGAPLIQLLDANGGPADRPDLSYRGITGARGLAAIRHYADGIGPAKTLIIPRRVTGRSRKPTQLIEHAHRQGLLVHAWTFRGENAFLPAELRRGSDPRAHGDASAEYRMFLELGVDGVFSDFPAAAVAALDGA